MLWEYGYDLIIWEKKNTRLMEKEFYDNFAKSKFRITFSKIYSLFISKYKFI